MATCYALLDPRDGKARYVGRTDSPETRRQAYLRFRRNNCTPTIRPWISELRALGMQPTFEVLEGDDERAWILKLRAAGAPLLNKAPGGGGRPPGPPRGRLEVILPTDALQRLERAAEAKGRGRAAFAADLLVQAIQQLS